MVNVLLVLESSLRHNLISVAVPISHCLPQHDKKTLTLARKLCFEQIYAKNHAKNDFFAVSISHFNTTF